MKTQLATTIKRKAKNYGSECPHLTTQAIIEKVHYMEACAKDPMNARSRFVYKNEAKIWGAIADRRMDEDREKLEINRVIGDLKVGCIKGVPGNCRQMKKNHDKLCAKGILANTGSRPEMPGYTFYKRLK